MATQPPELSIKWHVLLSFQSCLWSESSTQPTEPETSRPSLTDDISHPVNHQALSILTFKHLKNAHTSFCFHCLGLSSATIISHWDTAMTVVGSWSLSLPTHSSHFVIVIFLKHSSDHVTPWLKCSNDSSFLGETLGHWTWYVRSNDSKEFVIPE